MRVDRALALTAIAYNRESKSAALSFGALEVSEPMVVEKKLRVENLGSTAARFSVTPSFRYADDEASGAVRVRRAVQRCGLGPRRARTSRSSWSSTRASCPTWTLNGGSLGGNGAAAQRPGVRRLPHADRGQREAVACPGTCCRARRPQTDAELVAARQARPVAQAAQPRRRTTGEYDVFSLTGSSTKIPRSEMPGPGDNLAVIDLRAVGVRYLPADWQART